MGGLASWAVVQLCNDPGEPVGGGGGEIPKDIVSYIVCLRPRPPPPTPVDKGGTYASISPDTHYLGKTYGLSHIISTPFLGNSFHLSPYLGNITPLLFFSFLIRAREICVYYFTITLGGPITNIQNN